MTCKDCLYNKNCQFLASHKTADVNGCTAFEDKSEWVHLPCKVNSTVYIVSEYRGVIESNVRKIFLGLNGAEMIRTQHYDIPFSNWGKTTFLTREEAEKALKDRKEK